MSNPILKVAFELPNGREIVIMDTIDGKLQMVTDCLPNWDADGKSVYIPTPKKEKKKPNKKKSEKYFNDLANK